MEQRPAQILLVEDSPTDQLLAREALSELSFSYELRIASDGVEAMSFLLQTPPNEHASRPDLILLDLNLPRKSGREVLAEIKTTTPLAQIPVVVLTTSNSDQDVREAYALHANCYIVKELGYEPYCAAMRAIRDFWFGTVRLPPRSTKRTASETNS